MRNYLALAYKSDHEWWRYLVGFFLIFIIWQVGTIPFITAVSIQLARDGESLMGIQNHETLMGTLDSNLTFFLMLLSFAFGFLGVWITTRFLHNQKFKDLITSREKFDWSRVLVGISIVGVFILVMTIIDYRINPDEYIFNFQLKPFLILAVIGILMVPLQTTFEELFFRGYLMQGLGVIFKNRAVPLLVTSIGFGLMHLGNPEVDKMGTIIMVSYIGTGFLLGIMALMDEGLELPIGYHIGNNLITALLVTADWTAFQTESVLISTAEPNATLEAVMPVLVIYPIYLFILAKIYKWKNWKEKLFGKIIKKD
ncbi:MAG: CPBP family intramembrane glutamic endopeptidase [Bacteroidota bacterium]